MERQLGTGLHPGSHPLCLPPPLTGEIYNCDAENHFVVCAALIGVVGLVLCSWYYVVFVVKRLEHTALARRARTNPVGTAVRGSCSCFVCSSSTGSMTGIHPRLLLEQQ